MSHWQSEKGTPNQRGMVGLRNLGNSSSMNSIIQCLLQIPQFTEYFLQNRYISDINETNPLGWEGRVAKAFAELLHQIYSDQYTVIAPKAFRSVLRDVCPRLTAYSTIDSQEIMSFLLDGLHEDLNRVSNKPFTDNIETDNDQNSEVIAIESWQIHLRRNQSIIVDLFEGQLKSKVVCPDCQRISITFDPFLCLTVPLPIDKYMIIPYSFIDISHSTPESTVFYLKISPLANGAELKRIIARKHKVLKCELFAYEIWKGTLFKSIDETFLMNKIREKSDEIFVYHCAHTSNHRKFEKNECGLLEEYLVFAFIKNNILDSSNTVIPMDLIEIVSLFYDTQFKTFEIINYKRDFAQIPSFGIPLMIALPTKVKISCSYVYDSVCKIMKAYIRDTNGKCLPFIINTTSALYFSGHCSKSELTNDENKLFDTSSDTLKFCILWHDITKYKSFERVKDQSIIESAVLREVELSECIDRFCAKEVFEENDAWFCAQCNDFKCATKQTHLWNTNEIIVICLKRANDTKDRNYYSQILVKFPLNGLDLSSFVMDKKKSKTAIYDCFAVCNRWGPGDHGSAYCKSLYDKEWYFVDDSQVSKVYNRDKIVSSLAYILLYRKQDN